MKASLFKNKYILYEDECMQVGFKSTPVYEKVDKFASMLDFELFFGNKTARTIDKFEVSFKGDKRTHLPMQKVSYIPARRSSTASSTPSRR
jgi:hypothetical protein